MMKHSKRNERRRARALKESPAVIPPAAQRALDYLRRFAQEELARQGRNQEALK